VAIRGREDTVQGRLRHVVPGLLRYVPFAGHGVALNGILVHRHQAIVQRHVDVLSAAAVHAAEERGADRGDGVGSRVHVAQRNAQERRRFAGCTHHLHDSALGFCD
jgi:hypothetical protein